MEEKLKIWVEEFLKIIKEHEKPSEWIEKERKNGNLKIFFPELADCFNIQQNQYHKYDVYYHLLYSCDAAEKNELIRIAALFHDIGKPKCKKENKGENVFYNHEIIGTEIAFQVLKRWEFPRNLVKNITLLIRYHMFHYQNEWTDSAVRRVMFKVGRENIENLFLLRVADREGNGFRKGEPLKLKDFKKRIQKIIDFENKFKINDLNITGNDLIKIGIPQGPFLGTILKHLFQKVITEEIENKYELLIKEAEEYIHASTSIYS